MKILAVFICLAAFGIFGAETVGATTISQSRREFHISIVVDCVETAVDQIRSLGGISLSESVRQHTWGAQAELRRRVDSWAIDHVMAVLRSLGEVQAESESLTYYGGGISDTGARLTAANVEVGRLLEILARSESLEMLIAVERQLSSAEHQRDSLMGRMNQLNDIVAAPYLFITLREHPGEIVPFGPLPFGERLSNSFTQGVRGYGAFWGHVMVLLARMSLQLIFLGSIAGIGFVLVRRKMKAHMAIKNNETGGGKI